VARLLRSLSPRCYSMLPIANLRAVRPSHAGMYTGLLVRQLSTRSSTHVSAALPTPTRAIGPRAVLCADEYAFIDTSRRVAELVQAQAKRPAMPAHFPFAVVAAQFSKSALLLALSIEGPWKQLMYLDDDAGFVLPLRVPSLSAIFGGVSTHLCSGKGVSIDELATHRSSDGTTAVIKSLYYERMHPQDPQVVSARLPRLMLAAAQPNVWDGSLKWCSACTARARHWPLRGWVDDCPVNSGMILVGTCPAAQYLLAAWSALSPANGECAAMINWRPSINASIKEAEDIARTPTDLREEGHPLRVCPCSVRCKDQHALNSLLENEFLGSAVVVNDALVNGKQFADGSTPKYIQHVWCGSGQTSKEACSEIRNATAFSWLGDAAEGPGLDELVPRAIVWKEALLLVRARHDRHRSSSSGERKRSRV